MMTDIAPSELAADLLARGHTVRLRAAGGSMRPFIRPGTVVTVEPLADTSRLRVGDVVFVLSGGLPMMHRVVRAAPHLRTKGDALGHYDPPPDTVLGKIIGYDGLPGRVVAFFSCLFQPVQLALILLRQWVIKMWHGRASEIA